MGVRSFNAGTGRGLTLPSSGHAPASRGLPLKSNVRSMPNSRRHANRCAGRPPVGGRRTRAGPQRVPRSRCGIRASWHGTTFARCPFRLQPAARARAARPPAGSEPSGRAAATSVASRLISLVAAHLPSRYACATRAVSALATQSAEYGLPNPVFELTHSGLRPPRAAQHNVSPRIEARAE